jgi:hypothetical protein
VEIIEKENPAVSCSLSLPKCAFGVSAVERLVK